MKQVTCEKKNVNWFSLSPLERRAGARLTHTLTYFSKKASWSYNFLKLKFIFSHVKLELHTRDLKRPPCGISSQPPQGVHGGLSPFHERKLRFDMLSFSQSPRGQGDRSRESPPDSTRWLHGRCLGGTARLTLRAGAVPGRPTFLYKWLKNFSVS